MKQLTRKEIYNIVSYAIHDERVKPMREGSYALAEASIKALEEAGVLMLVDHDERPLEHDIIKTKHGGVQNIIFDHHGHIDTGTHLFEKTESFYLYAEKIIQRANTPVYQCKKE